MKAKAGTARSTCSRRRCAKENQPKLWEGLKKDKLQVVSTDHCPFCFADQKSLGKDDFTKIPTAARASRTGCNC